MIRKSVVKSLTPGVMTTLYEVPANKKAEIRMIWISNPGSNNKEIELDVYNAAADETIIVLDGYTVNSDSFLQLGGTENTFVCMAAGDKLLAEATTGSNFSVIVSFVEEKALVQGG